MTDMKVSSFPKRLLDGPLTPLRVKLSGEDGNAFNLIAKVRKAMVDNGYAHVAPNFAEEAMSGTYGHLLQVIVKYVEVE